MRLNNYPSPFRITAYAATLTFLSQESNGAISVAASVRKEVDSVERSMLPSCNTDLNISKNGTFMQEDDSFCEVHKMDKDIPGSELEQLHGEEKEETEKKEETSLQEEELKEYEEEKQVIQEECGVYLAPSTIPGAGLGMFAGKSYGVHDTVTQGDIIIPLSSLDWHNDFKLDFFLWEEYTWDGDMFPGLNDEIEMETIQYCSTGIGAAINCVLPLVNLADERIKVDNAGLNHVADPGAGAFTALHDRSSYALYEIEAGSELFMDYGEHYFGSRTETYGLMPLHKSYENADGFIGRFDALMKRLRHRTSQKKSQRGRQGLPRGLSKDLYELVKNLPYESRTLNALPEFLGLNNALDEGSQWQHYNRSKVQLDFLSKNGQCMDNIYPGRSTVKQAGRGVFASRIIKNGGLVAPAPLIHIKDKKQLLMYDEIPENRRGIIARNASSPNHNQLLLNYCFGHPESTLSLSPYGMFTSLINHASLSSGKVNAKVAWSKTMRSPQWKEQNIDEWIGNSYSGLSIDFVATRDIQPDEEIFIDYGEDWGNAWDAHVKEWESSLNGKNLAGVAFTSAFQLDENLELHVPTRNDDNALCFEHNINGYIREEYRLMAGYSPRDAVNNYHRCRPISKFLDNNNEPLYMVELVRRKNDPKRRKCWIVIDEIMFNVPRDSFVFVDRASVLDQLSTRSFRHDMMIPDEIFPEAWKNLI